jgi:hypothetical protein
MAFHLPIYHHSHHRDDVTAPHGRTKFRSRLDFRHSQEGRPRSSEEHVVALGEGKRKKLYPEDIGTTSFSKVGRG